MGRRPKYLTTEDRTKATQERRRRYADSAHGKAVRSEQNRRAYRKRQQNAKSDNASETTLPVLTLPEIPKLVKRQGREPLPLRSEYYQKEIRSHGDIPDHEMYSYWDHPPYRNPAQYIPSIGFVAHSDAVIARRRRRQRVAEGLRIARYEISTDQQILKEIHDDILKTLEEWNDLRMLLAETKAGSSIITHTMGVYLLYHKARYVLDLVEDWHGVLKGRGEYGLVVVHSNRW